MRFKVVNLSGNIYQVLEKVIVDFQRIEDWNVLFQGTLPECEAWIRLKEGGYLK